MVFQYAVVNWAWLRTHHHARSLGFISELQAEQKQIEQEVKLFMQDNELASSDSFRVSWKNIDATKLDTKRIKEECPELYADYGKVSHSRRFEVKAA